MKHCSMRKEKSVIDMYYQESKRDMAVIDRFLKNDMLRLFKCLQLLESTTCCQKSRCDYIVALCILL